MSVIQKVQVTNGSKRCECCGRSLPYSQFARVTSEFFVDAHLPYCNSCITKKIQDHSYSWDYIDKLCQWADIPWIVKEWVRISEFTLEDETWSAYTKIFQSADYDSIGWDYYYKQYKNIKEKGLIEEEIPLVREQRYARLRETWGDTYSDNDLLRLEALYNGLLRTQNVSGTLQIDQAQKLCKLSLEIDKRIVNGDKDVEKFISSYDKVIKMGEFTPKNVKNATDFDSFGELAYWLEKRGHMNKFYDGVTRDAIDATLKNIESYNQRLYVNEGGIGEEITERLQALKLSSIKEDEVFDIQPDFKEDEYQNAAFVVDQDFDPSEEAPRV